MRNSDRERLIRAVIAVMNGTARKGESRFARAHVVSARCCDRGRIGLGH